MSMNPRVYDATSQYTWVFMKPDLISKKVRFLIPAVILFLFIFKIPAALSAEARPALFLSHPVLDMLASEVFRIAHDPVPVPTVMEVLKEIPAPKSKSPTKTELLLSRISHDASVQELFARSV